MLGDTFSQTKRQAHESDNAWQNPRISPAVSCGSVEKRRLTNCPSNHSSYQPCSSEVKPGFQEDVALFLFLAGSSFNLGVNVPVAFAARLLSGRSRNRL